jgi:hypothetical protein
MARPVSVAHLRRKARRGLPTFVFDFVDGPEGNLVVEGVSGGPTIDSIGPDALWLPGPSAADGR